MTTETDKASRIFADVRARLAALARRLHHEVAGAAAGGGAVCRREEPELRLRWIAQADGIRENLCRLWSEEEGA